WERGWSFIKKAGTIITLASVAVWFTSSFGFAGGAFGAVEDIDASIIARIGSAIAFLFKPLGFGSWQATVATLLGLVAKEEVVGVFGTLFAVAGDALELVEEGEFAGLANIASQFTLLSAYSFMIFNLLCAPCFAAIGAIRREMNSAKWTLAAIGWECGFAYAASLIVYQLVGFVTGEVGIGLGTLAALIVLGVGIWALIRPYKESNTLETAYGSKK
ncbi:MAG: nucleoside recognition domain-containing protein, partial [Clostridiales bacterium]|nr:nucleoside recognition domain-containing protein [Clostridiales bacterium]MDY5513263.1 nucleoside recognition domain-containing protein [Candidatus Ventricola sp.]